MKGETINFRKKDNSWVSGFFLPEATTEVSVNSRKYYNYCRNDSSSVKDALAWDSCTEQDINYVRYRNDYRLAQMSQTARVEGRYNQEQDEEPDRQYSMTSRPQSASGERTNKISIKKFVEEEKERSLGDNQKQTEAGQVTVAKKPVSKARAASLQPKQQVNQQQQQKVQQSRDRKRAALTLKKDKSAERLKIEEYVKSLIPYTRDLPSSRLRTFYGKAPMEAYGKNNTNEPIGGIIYGNHMKSFNIGPHTSGNDPKYYQSHTTTINFAKRTKLSEQQKWRRFEKEMAKKLNLKQVNHSLKEGLQPAVQVVNEGNMYDLMKQTNEFQTQNSDKIRAMLKQQEKQKTLTNKAQVEERRQQRIADKQAFKNNPLAAKSEMSPTVNDGLSVEERMKHQIIYKLVDENGVARYSTDRHGLTCFVDLNFPENQAAYKQELINRNPIQPIEVREKDRNIDALRRQNHIDSVVNSYPAHYLVPNVDYSQVKWGGQDKASRSPGKSKGRATSSQAQRQQNKQPLLIDEGSGIKTQRQVSFREEGSQPRKSLESTVKPTRPAESQPQTARISKKERSAEPKSQEYYPKSARNCCSPDIKQVLLERAERDPHLAGKLLDYCRKYECETDTHATSLVDNSEYDPSNYCSHAVHELNPQLYTRVEPYRIPYAGLPSTKNKLS